MAVPKISASIVLYGELEKARQCIGSLLNETKGAELSLFVIDNASPDHAGEILQKEFGDRAHFLLLQENLGFGRAHNLVLPYLESDYHAVVNPDILLKEDALSALGGYLQQNPEVVMATPRLYFPDGREQLVAKRRPTLMALLGRQLPFHFLKKYEDYYLMKDRDLSQQQEIEFCTGCFFVARTAVLKEIGGFDERYFLYVEDADITQKALRKGRVVYWPGTRVYHAWNRQPSRSGSHFTRQLRSMLRYFQNWGFRFGFGDHA
ncbi:MAG: glycosyltransferase family 2 protein [Oscillospiraceae bacterium]|nr:glycosyltransferase family 2 protein [Oscillospiraceae bacterium]